MQKYRKFKSVNGKAPFLFEKQTIDNPDYFEEDYSKSRFVCILINM